MTREEAIKILKDLADVDNSKPVPNKLFHEAFDMAIEALSADTVQGEWIEVEDDYDNIYWECSNCEDAFVLEVGTPKDNNYNYCPSCGARMKGGDTE